MSRPKRPIEARATIDGVNLVWHLHREQQWCNADGWKGLSIRVSTEDALHRELLLEYPVARTQKEGWSRVDLVRPRIHPKKVESHIKLAMAAGWDSNSRGKPFAFQVRELPG